MIDTKTEFGRRVNKRLIEERIIWLTTISKRGIPSPRPVWFLWDGDSFLIYSRYKVEHIQQNEWVSLNFDGDGLGGDIIIFSGLAEIDKSASKADQVPEYVEKYKEGFKRINMSPELFGDSYSVAIHIKPTGLRGH